MPFSERSDPVRGKDGGKKKKKYIFLSSKLALSFRLGFLVRFHSPSQIWHNFGVLGATGLVLAPK